MKQVQFTLQFVVLLAAMPLLVVMQFTHDGNSVKEKISTESESVYISRPSVSGDVFLSPNRLVLM